MEDFGKYITANFMERTIRRGGKGGREDVKSTLTYLACSTSES